MQHQLVRVGLHTILRRKGSVIREYERRLWPEKSIGLSDRGPMHDRALFAGR